MSTWRSRGCTEEENIENDTDTFSLLQNMDVLEYSLLIRSSILLNLYVACSYIFQLYIIIIRDLNIHHPLFVSLYICMFQIYVQYLLTALEYI